MKRIACAIIGAGQAGLAMSRCLADRGIDHVVLDRRGVADRWRAERWPGLRLLTPNWMTRLPGHAYAGDDPDGFMTMPEVATLLDDYAQSFNAPVETGTTVGRVVPGDGGGYRITTDRGVWHADAVAVATGECDRPAIPSVAAGLSGAIRQTVPTRYHGPQFLPPGGVLIVGASASGVQLAEELALAGRQVTLAVGRHTRIPRRWRGRDIFFWLDRAGVLDDRWDQVRDIAAARRQPSLQLAGRPDGRSIDLASLSALGVRLTGRVVAADGAVVHLAGDLDATTAEAQRRLARLLGRLDLALAEDPLWRSAPEDECPAPIPVPATPSRLNLAAEGIGSVVWATGFRRSYPWLGVPVTGPDGEIRHDGGITAAPGLVVLGLRFLRTRKSSFIDGVGADAEALAAHLAHRWQGRRRAA